MASSYHAAVPLRIYYKRLSGTGRKKEKKLFNPETYSEGEFRFWRSDLRLVFPLYLASQLRVKCFWTIFSEHKIKAKVNSKSKQKEKVFAIQIFISVRQRYSLFQGVCAR